MANDNFPRGLYPLKPPAGGMIPCNIYEVSTAADIYLGQPVGKDAGGLLVGAATAGASGVLYLGVALGFLDANQASIPETDPFLDVSDATGARYVIVSDDPNQEYLVQEDTGGTALALTERGATIDLIYRGGGGAVTGDANTGWATLELDASTVVTTNSGALTIQRLHDQINSDGTQNAVGDYAKWVCTITNHQRRGQPMVNTAV